MDVLRKTASCAHSLHHESRTENVRKSPPHFLRQGGKDNESHHRRFGRHHAHGHRRGETIEIPAGHVLTAVKTALESTESTGVQSSDFAPTVRTRRHGGQGRHGISESEDSHGSHGRHRSHGGFRGEHRRGEMSARLVAGRETAGEAENMTAGGVSESGAGGRGERHGRHGSHGGRGMRHATNDVSSPTAEPKAEGGDVSGREV